jgi:biopolymer transport protein ExbB
MMFEIVRAGGWLMLPLILCSVVAVAITAERLWSLQRKRVLPSELSGKVASWVDRRQLDARHVKALQESSPLGQILAAGVVHRDATREVMKESIEDTGRHVVHDLERFLNTLGTIAAITPLLGLLGTVIGMVKVFAAITAQGVGNPAVLAGGISEALITTATGLSIAIPTLIVYRYFRRRVDTLVLEMEQEAIELVAALTGTPSVRRENASHPAERTKGASAGSTSAAGGGATGEPGGPRPQAPAPPGKGKGRGKGNRGDAAADERPAPRQARRRASS